MKTPLCPWFPILETTEKMKEKKTPQQLAPQPHWKLLNTAGSLRRLLGRSDGVELHPTVGLLGVEVFCSFCLVKMTEIHIVGDHYTMPHSTCSEDHKGFPMLGSDTWGML